MKRKDYFLLALKHGLHRKQKWLLSVLSMTAGVTEKDLGDYEVMSLPTGYSYLDPEQGLVKITDAPGGVPLIDVRRGISLKAGDVPNLDRDVVTTYGNVIFNMCVLVPGFGSKVPFVEGLVSVNKIESYLADRLLDTPKPNERKDTELYCDEYVKFVDGLIYLTELNNVLVWGLTEKAITPPKGVKELKAELLEKYRDRLHDPLVISTIYKELIKLDTEYLKGDPSENFLTSNKLRNVVRRKLFLINGAEPGLGNRNELDLVTNSLYEGLENDKFRTMLNIARAGIFDRGSETQLGGVSTKEILRATSNIRIVKGDCGTKLGLELLINEENHTKLKNLRVIQGNESPLVTEAETSKYIGQVIQRRSPQFCKLEKTDFCEYCVGKRLADTETGASIAATELGGVFLGIFMASMHAKDLEVQEMDLVNSFT